MRYLLGQGCDEFYEVGPGRVLRGLLKRIDRKIPCHGVARSVTGPSMRSTRRNGYRTIATQLTSSNAHRTIVMSDTTSPSCTTA